MNAFYKIQTLFNPLTLLNPGFFRACRPQGSKWPAAIYQDNLKIDKTIDFLPEISDKLGIIKIIIALVSQNSESFKVIALCSF